MPASSAPHLQFHPVNYRPPPEFACHVEAFELRLQRVDQIADVFPLVICRQDDYHS